MTSDQFWSGDPTLVIYYREADRLRLKRENYIAYIQGAYYYKALICVAPVMVAFPKKNAKAEPYINEPFPIGKSNEELMQSEKRKLIDSRDAFRAFATNFNKHRKEAVP